MKPFFKISRLPIVLLIVFTVFENVAEAQVHPLVSCTITGSSSVSLGSTSTYNCSCSASSWTVTCGTIQSSTSTSVTVHFNVYDCNLATIKANGTTAATKTVTVTYPPLAGGTISNTNQNINYNTAPAQINASAASGGDCSSYSYQWYSSTDNITYNIISGATSLNYQPGVLATSTYFKRQTICSSDGAWTTNYAYVNVYPVLVPGSVTPSQTIDFNTASAPMSISGISGGNGTYTYQWQSSSDNIHWTIISGATTTTYTSGNLTSPTYFNVSVTSNGFTANSNAALVTLYPQVSGGTIIPAYLNITSGTNPGEITCSPASGGSCGNSYSYQWQSSADGANFSNISGVTTKNYSPGVISSNIWFKRKVTCGTIVAYSTVCQIAIGTINTSYNYIRERAVLKAGVTDTVTADGLSSPFDVAQTTQYFDGLGRLVQTVAKKATPAQNDLVVPVVYDNFGRQSVNYMPYAATTNDGNFKATAIADQYNFNAGQFPNEQYYYSEINFETSPLNRPIASLSPGMNWIGNNTGIASQYLMNSVADSVQIWNISSKQLDIPLNGGRYLSGQLYKNVTADEQGHQIVTYKDKLGKTILVKQQLAGSPSTGHAGWLNTYYVYDTLQNLRFVLQPQAVALINGSWVISQNIANELCFRYEYDGRRRMIIKKVPGAGQVWEVYDARNRPVMTQDSALRVNHKWMFIKYDVENRSDSVGFITDPTNYNNLAYHDTLAYHSTNYPLVSSYTNELITMNFYDDYSWVSSHSAPVGSAMATNYTSNSNYFITSYNTSPTYAVALASFPIVHGMPTGSMKKAMDATALYMYAVNFYDDRGRVIQSQSVNYTGGIDTVTMQYNFKGALLRSLVNHKKSGNTAQTHIVLTKLDYDHGFRLRHIWKNIDGAAGDQLIDSIQYNELGQLHAKYLGNSLDSLIYDYNVRGWLKGINKSYVAGTANHFFGMELGYDSLSVAPGNVYLHPVYNGDIGGTVWKSAGDGVNRKYDYSYDNANRLTSAAFLQNTTGSAWDKSYLDFSVSGISYDANGNILSMTQRGFTVGGSSAVDSLTYNYLNTNGNNKLMGVSDLANNPGSLLGDFHYNTSTKQSTDYTYDGNGNLITDNNKAIDNITYNYLNQQQSVHMNTKGTVSFIYDATGTRLKKVVSDSVSRHSTTTLYLGGFIYQQTDTITSPGGGTDTLQFILHEEGRTRWAWHKYTNGTSAYKFEYDFFEKDQVGNTRMVLTQQKDTAQYLASMEGAFRSTEVQLFGNITNTAYARNSVSGYPTNTIFTNPNDSVSKVDFNGSSGQKTGPTLLLKVMSGDTVKIGVQSYYNTGSGSTNNTSFTDVLNSLANAVVSSTGGNHGSAANFTANNSTVYSAVQNFLNNKESTPTGYPKAFLNWIFLDDQFNYVSSLSGVVQAASATYPAATLNTLAPGAPITLTKSGYLYIWVSNETQGWDVFFDNLSVQHLQGPMLEENHYYPFGLTMQGISDKALKTRYTENKYRYNEGTELQNKEFSDGTGLELYETNYRSFDPQLGRFGQIDLFADQTAFLSTFQYAGNNPISANDPEGLKAQTPEEIRNIITGGLPPGNSQLIGGGGSALGHDLGTGDDGGSFGISDYYMLSGPAALDFISANYSDFSGNYSYSSANAGPGASNSGDFLHNNLQTVGVMSSTVYKGQEFVDQNGVTWNLSGADLAQNSDLSFIGINGAIDATSTLIDGVVQGAQKLANVATSQTNKIVPLENVPILGAIGTIATGINTGHKLQQFIDDPGEHWFDLVEAVGTLGIAIFAPEVLVGYQLVTTAIDLYREYNH